MAFMLVLSDVFMTSRPPVNSGIIMAPLDLHAMECTIFG